MQCKAVDVYSTYPDRRPPKSKDNGEIDETHRGPVGNKSPGHKDYI